jgi:hypothetical protein
MTWLLSKAGAYVIGGAVLLSIVGGVYWKVTSYIEDHKALEAAYDRQQLELNQAVEVNRHNADEIAHIKAEHAATLAQLQGQLDSEALTLTTMEDQLTRLRSLAAREPEVRFVEGECPEPDSVITAVLADPFGLPIDSNGN